MDKEATARSFWTAVAVMYVGGIVAYYAGIKPQGEFSSEVIPVDEPTAIDWIQVGGIMFLM
jgi:hypothetical protein